MIKWYKSAILFLSLFSLFLIAEAYAGSEWELSMGRPDVKVYTRPVIGSSFIELKGVTSISASLSAVVALLDDVDFNPEWVPNSGGATVLKRLGPKESYVRGVILTPWPFYDRDMIVHFRLEQDPDTYMVTIEMTGMPGYHSLQEGYVRISGMNGFWKIIPGSDGILEIVYQLHTEPDGLLPAWLVNRFAVGTVYKTLINIRKAVKNEKYRSVSLPFIAEP